MIDFNGEKPISPAEAAEACNFPGRGTERPSPKTIVNWMTTGIRSKDGGRVLLEGRLCVSRWFTTREALRRFFNALAATAEDSTAMPRPELREAVAV